MTIEEALLSINELKNKIRHTKSRKLKIKYMINIITLQQFLISTYGFAISDERIDIDVPNLLEETVLTMEKGFYNYTGRFIELNDFTKKLSDGCINIFKKSGFVPYLIPESGKQTSINYEELFLEFISELGDKVVKKYNEMNQNGIILSRIGDFGGLCWDFQGQNRQVISINSEYIENKGDIAKNQEFFKVLSHELGHAVSINILNNTGVSKTYIGGFDESISILFEKMFLNFLEKNNIDISRTIRNDQFLLFCKSLIAKVGVIAVEDSGLINNGEILIPNRYFTEEYIGEYSYLFDKAEYIDYVDQLPYFYGELIALLFMDKHRENYKDAIKEMIDFLIQAETQDPKTLLENIGLTKVPKGLARSLKKRTVK